MASNVVVGFLRHSTLSIDRGNSTRSITREPEDFGRGLEIAEGLGLVVH